VIADQPPPIPNGRRPIVDLVVEDLVERKRIGTERYGTPLQAHNGRDALVDAYQEALDQTLYLRQEIEERQPLTPEQRRAWAEEQLVDEEEGALFMDGLDAAIVGIGRQFTKPPLVVYDYALIVETLVKGSDMPEDEVVEYVDFNIIGAWVGERTPFVINVPSVDD
jgi:hypothetical protein